MLRKKVNFIMGAQAGHEGVGDAAAYLVSKYQLDVVTAYSATFPWPEHSAIANGKTVRTRQIPVSIHGHTFAVAFFGPGSTISLEDLQEDLAEMSPECCAVDAQALVVEDINGRPQAASAGSHDILKNDLRLVKPDVRDLLLDALKSGATILCEVYGGFDRCSIHGVGIRGAEEPTRYHKPVNPLAAMAELGLPQRYLGHVYGVFEPTIRWRGFESLPSDLYADSEILGTVPASHDSEDPQEIAFDFSFDRIQKFIQVCDPDLLYLSSAELLDPRVAKVRKYKDLPDSVTGLISQIESRTAKAVAFVGAGRSILDRKIDRMGLDTRRY